MQHFVPTKDILESVPPRVGEDLEVAVDMVPQAKSLCSTNESEEETAGPSVIEIEPGQPNA